MVATLVMILAIGASSEEVGMKFVAMGATAKVGGYRPMRAELNAAADSVKKAPEGLAAPKYGTLTIGNQNWAVIVDEPEQKPARLYVDTNADGDLTNDPQATWTANTNNGLTMYQGQAQVDLGKGTLGSLGLYRFDPKDPQRAPLKSTLLFYTDYGYEITVNLDGKEFTSFISGMPASNSSLWIDRDGNKRTSYKREMVYVGKPFNFTGTTYTLTLSDGRFTLDKAPSELPITPPPPDLSVGQKALPFKMAAMDGTEIDFPKTYAGKLVMLDFWATWCGPCIAELPNVKNAYEAWHDKGFEVLGISFDSQDMGDKLTAFTKEKGMPWPQLYEGKQWDTTLGELYDVSGIPFVLLVDGDSGEILGTAQELRGPGLSDFIGKALSKKNGDTEHATSPDREGIAGEWVNRDNGTRGLKRLMVTSDGSKWSINAWGSGGGGEIPWGETKLALLGKNVAARELPYGFATWSPGFADTYLILRLEKEALEAEVLTIFKDDSGRSNYRSVESFRRK